MNRDEQDLARRIVGHLDDGLGKLNDGTLYSLHAARKAALQHARTEAAEELAWAGAGGRGGLSGFSRYVGWRYLLPLLAVVVAVAGSAYWHQAELLPESLAEVDARLLSDDLPIDAYLDKGFDSWLKRSSH